MTTLSLTSPGNFVVGCNYWASHAGTRMWSDWYPDIVDADLEQLSKAGLQVLRVFPLWPDFQPLTLLRTGGGQPREYRLGEEPLSPDEAGGAGISLAMMERFAIFTDLAQRHGLKLVVGLVTGWMSGRLFVPPAFEGVNVLTDPAAIQWQVRFVRYFVHRFKDSPAILAWDLGNECNCMAPVPSRQAAWVWTNAITSAIRLKDPTRPVVSGMHSLLPGGGEPWTMQDQGELTDILTTHPYPYFTPHANSDPVTTIRTILHSTAESRFYADIGGKPCLVEEIGTLGPMFASEAVAANFVRSVLFSLWAHDCHGLFWWCAYDQLGLEHAPYDWESCERELGLIRGDRSEKPVLQEIGEFAAFLKQLPIEVLPPCHKEAVCILTEGQDTWGVAYSTFILAKQAGFDLEFQYADQPIKPATLYLAPCVRGTRAFTRRAWLELLERVKDGATLYLSHDDCLLSPVNAPFGIEIQTRARNTGPVEWRMDGIQPGLRLFLNPSFRLRLITRGADVLGHEEDGNPIYGLGSSEEEINGNPIFTCAPYGKGKIYFLAAPIELELTLSPGTFHSQEAQPFWKIYRHIVAPFLAGRALHKEDAPLVGISEHLLPDGKRIIILVNYSPEEQVASLIMNGTWELGNCWYGEAPHIADYKFQVFIHGNEANVFTLNPVNPPGTGG